MLKQRKAFARYSGCSRNLLHPIQTNP